MHIAQTSPRPAHNSIVTYEEKGLIWMLGEEIIAYQERVPKWFPPKSCLGIATAFRAHARKVDGILV